MSDIENRVKKVISNQMGIEEAAIKNASHIRDDLGADSLDSVELTMYLEDEFEIQISDEDAERIETVQHAIDYVTERLSKRAA